MPSYSNQNINIVAPNVETINPNLDNVNPNLNNVNPNINNVSPVSTVNSNNFSSQGSKPVVAFNHQDAVNKPFSDHLEAPSPDLDAPLTVPGKQ